MPWFLLSGGGAQRTRNTGGTGMHINPKEGHPDMDYAEHMATYKLFCKITLWTVIILTVIMALMAVFLT